MKHYYISRDNKTLYSVDIEKPRQGYYYVGEFESTDDAIQKVRGVLRDLMHKKNNSLGTFTYDIKRFNNASNKELCWALVLHLEG